MEDKVDNGIIISVTASGLFSDVKFSNDVNRYLNLATLGFVGPIWKVVGLLFGGYWVGGEVSMTKREFKFKANGLNKALQANDCTLLIENKDILSVDVDNRILMRGINLSYYQNGDKIFKFRCANPKNIAGIINSYINKSN